MHWEDLVLWMKRRDWIERLCECNYGEEGWVGGHSKEALAGRKRRLKSG